MAGIGTGYDLSVTTFSPDGRVFQTEYAQKAVDNAGTAAGIRCKDGVVLAVEKLVLSKMLVPGSNRRIHAVDRHAGIATTGLAPDGRQIVNRAQSEAANYKQLNGSKIPGHVLNGGLLPSTTSSASTGVATVGCLAGPGHSLAFKFIPHPMPSRTGRCSLHSGARPLTRRLCQASQASLWPSSLTEFFFFRLPSPPTCVPNQTTAAHSSPAGNPNPVPLSVETPTLCSPCQVRGKRSRDCCGGAASFPPLPLPLSAFSFTCFPSPRSPAGLQDRAALRLQLPSRGRGQERPGAVPDRALRDRERYFGAAVGKGRQQARTEIERLKLSEMTCREGVKELAKIIYRVHEEEKPFELEMGWVCEESGMEFRHVPAEVQREAEEFAKAALEAEDMEDDGRPRRAQVVWWVGERGGAWKAAGNPPRVQAVGSRAASRCPQGPAASHPQRLWRSRLR
eukprot:CAMPEP_0177627542 /NCGR_PEP_ID=MMETSP0419_2-20121207/31259_1 /TAXON_ID=582737 /ORGANISM="Tetraselmis sp., Strain GSL018" /LENGTH=450 /DNA_ID=CAMNT_0019128703 /DNA_START=142 /DNA_END=1497 /DNA_ORIENTATION=-